MDWFEDINDFLNKIVDQVAIARKKVLEGVKPHKSSTDEGWTDESSLRTLLLINGYVSDCHKAVCGFKLVELVMLRNCKDEGLLSNFKQTLKFCHEAVRSFQNVINTYINYGKKNCWEIELFSTTVDLCVSTRKILKRSDTFIDVLKTRFDGETAPVYTRFAPHLTHTLSAPEQAVASAYCDWLKGQYEDVTKKMFAELNTSRRDDLGGSFNFPRVEETSTSDDSEYSNPSDNDYDALKTFQEQIGDLQEGPNVTPNLSRVDQSAPSDNGDKRNEPGQSDNGAQKFLEDQNTD